MSQCFHRLMLAICFSYLLIGCSSEQSIQPTTVQLRIPVALDDVNLEVSAWRVSCEVSQQALLSQPAPPAASWLERIWRSLGDFFGRSEKVSIPDSKTSSVLGLASSDPNTLGLVDNVFNIDFIGDQLISVELPGQPLASQPLRYECQLEFAMGDDPGWHVVLSEPAGYEHEDIRLKALENFPLNTRVTGSLNTVGEELTDAIEFTGGVLFDERALDIGATPHPGVLLQYVGVRCSVDDPDNTYSTNYLAIGDDVIDIKCSQCHESNNWHVSNSSLPSLLPRSGVEAPQNLHLSHPENLGVFCRDCHIPAAQVEPTSASYPLLSDVIAGRQVCSDCHGKMLRHWSGKRVCVENYNAPRRSHVPPNVWSLMRNFSDTAHCVGVDVTVLADPPGRDSWCPGA